MVGEVAGTLSSRPLRGNANGPAQRQPSGTPNEPDGIVDLELTVDNEACSRFAAHRCTLLFASLFIHRRSPRSRSGELTGVRHR